MNRFFIYTFAAVLLAGLLVGCQPGEDMAESEKLFIKMVDKTAGKLDLDENQKIQLEQLKVDIRKNFREGRKEKKEDLLLRICLAGWSEAGATEYVCSPRCSPSFWQASAWRGGLKPASIR